MRKKICIILISFMMIFLFTADIWDDYIIGMYCLNNTLNDDSGHSDDLSTAGTGGIFKTDIVYRGSHSVQVTAPANYFYIASGSDLISDLGVAPTWTVEGWTYVNSVASPNFWCPFISMSWGLMGDLTVAYKNSTDIVDFYYNGTNGSHACVITKDAWHFASVQYDDANNRVKLFVDNNLIVTYNGQTVNIFSSPVNNLAIGRGIYDDTYNSGSRNDKIGFSTILREGVESTPVPATLTITQTVVTTITQTITQTVTPTVTETITQTITPTGTPTSTPTYIAGYLETSQNIFNTKKWGTITVDSADGLSNSITVSGWDNDEYIIKYSFRGSIGTARKCILYLYDDLFMLKVVDENNTAVDCSGNNVIINWKGRKI